MLSRLAIFALSFLASTVSAAGLPPDPFAPPTGLSQDRLAQYERGRLIFSAHWRPSGTTGPDDFEGLGPLYNRISCASCHKAGGRGRAPDDPSRPFLTALIRIGMREADGTVGPHPHFGTQVQDRAVPGAALESRISLAWEETTGSFADGEEYSLRHPVLTIRPDPGPNAVASIRVAQPVRGLGALEGHEVGFGWKGAQPDLRHQNAAAMSGDMGLTSTLFPEPACPLEEQTCGGGPDEVGDSRLDDLTHFIRLLPALPPHATPNDQEGEKQFKALGCAACHDPSRPAMTDMQLHDMGAGLDDGLPEGDAESFEWRTQPLRGLGTILSRNPKAPLLHDGRARGPAEAILWHGGTAQASADGFKRLPASARNALIRYLEGL